MNVVFSRPPLFAEIDAAFHIAGKPVVFCFGEVIYNPERIKVPDEIIAHEAVHCAQQGRDIESWWHRYILEPQFRLDQELPAHSAEYKRFCENNPQGRSRPNRRMYMHSVAKRLSSPIYGSLIRYDDARRLLKAAVREA